ncbi:PREDICTED: uncharacterized protein LOC109353690 isoform X2 [Lupinus angustifolius]|nr:PREDICTED: uncharacterized protein LOC109353690 isoform X2 [Lupinus angustifolius]
MIQYYKMDLEEAESEEWNSNNNNKVRRNVFTLGKKILMAGIIASSAPIVLPPLVVASAIGIAVSMPYAFFYATHACTHNLMSKLLPTPTYNNTIDNDIQQQFETPFEVTNVVFEEFHDQEIDGEELQRETKGLLERIRDEGRDGNGGGEEYKVDNVNNNESENSMAQAEVEVASQSQVQDEIVEDLMIEMLHECNVLEAEDSNEVITEKIEIHMIVEQDPEPLIDGSTILYEGKLDNNVSDFVNQESQLHEYNEVTELSNADARGTADENIIDPEVYNYSIDLHEESSNVMVDGHTDYMEVSVSMTENKFKASECSSAEDIMCSSHQVVLDEENIWKQIHVIRKIIGYEGATQATCMDELKALYIFTGVEPPTILNENLCDLAEINEKLHFLMSIVGIKSNVP